MKPELKKLLILNGKAFKAQTRPCEAGRSI